MQPQGMCSCAGRLCCGMCTASTVLYGSATQFPTSQKIVIGHLAWPQGDGGAVARHRVQACGIVKGHRVAMAHAWPDQLLEVLLQLSLSIMGLCKQSSHLLSKQELYATSPCSSGVSRC